MALLPVEMPEVGRKVKAVIKTPKWELIKAELIHVDEDDQDWRFVEDNAELSYMVDVIYWEYI